MDEKYDYSVFTTICTIEICKMLINIDFDMSS